MVQMLPIIMQRNQDIFSDCQKKRKKKHTAKKQ